ncbi:hypothetical protein CERZMDRAFT_90021 [Cercospora zeae-maydis SCOH1-5]|uniref:Uncharacterized protein n=1 Tax=Cercospora zeae-maydis SCOH1-5 TaxID=717836 RepID=A0A6A6FRH4_9PEZI|nr:hypothetical protein CERZMDRAFT_90021 [Cercospora zeae-maydis SCOH1-5]
MKYRSESIVSNAAAVCDASMTKTRVTPNCAAERLQYNHALAERAPLASDGTLAVRSSRCSRPKLIETKMQRIPLVSAQELRIACFCARYPVAPLLFAPPLVSRFPFDHFEVARLHVSGGHCAPLPIYGGDDGVYDAMSCLASS